MTIAEEHTAKHEFRGYRKALQKDRAKSMHRIIVQAAKSLSYRDYCEIAVTSSLDRPTMRSYWMAVTELADTYDDYLNELVDGHLQASAFNDFDEFMKAYVPGAKFDLRGKRTD